MRPAIFSCRVERYRETAGLSWRWARVDSKSRPSSRKIHSARAASPTFASSNSEPASARATFRNASTDRRAVKLRSQATACHEITKCTKVHEEAIYNGSFVAFVAFVSSSCLREERYPKSAYRLAAARSLRSS